MDGSRFDSLTKELSMVSSRRLARRGALRALAGVLFGGTATMVPVAQRSAAACIARGEPCTPSDNGCCNGACELLPGPVVTDEGTCADCSAAGEICSNNVECCSETCDTAPPTGDGIFGKCTSSVPPTPDGPYFAPPPEPKKKKKKAKKGKKGGGKKGR